MPDIQAIIALLALAVVAFFAIRRPEGLVMAVGVFLFAQSAIVRVDAVPDLWRSVVSRADEIVLLVLATRFAVTRVRLRATAIPPSLRALAGLPMYAFGAFVCVAFISAVVNAVPSIQAIVGVYLAAKGGLWMFVALSLRYDARVVTRYITMLTCLFIAAIVLAMAQFSGATLPWDPVVRRSGELAATSIWNQHTVFGSAVAVAAGLAIGMLRIEAWRPYALVLAAAAGIGIVLSTVRRLLISLPVAVVLSLLTASANERHRVTSLLKGAFSRPAVFASLVLLLIAAGVIVGPRMGRVVVDTWDEYVVHADERDRYVLYRGGFELLLNSPLVGRGPGTYGSYSSVIFDSPAYEEVDVRLPDSLKMGAPYASLLGEFGLLGFATFAAFVILTFRQLVPVARSSGKGVSQAMATAGIFMLTNMAIESVVHVTFSDSFVAFFAFGAVGAAMATAGPVHTAEAGGANSSMPSSSRETPAPERRWLAFSALMSVFLMAVLVVGVAALEPARQAADPRPNVVIVLTAETSVKDVTEVSPSDNLEVEGDPAEAYAALQLDGTLFDRLRAPPDDYSSSLASLLTGQEPDRHQTSGGGHDLLEDYAGHRLEGAVLPDWLQSAGYRTAFIGRYFDGYGRWEEPIRLRDGHFPPGWDYWRAIWGRPSYYDYRLNENGEIWGRGAEETHHHTADMLTDIRHAFALGDERPLFLMVAPLAPAVAPISGDEAILGPVPLPADDGQYSGDRHLEALVGVGRLIAAIRGHHDSDRPTYFFFTSATSGKGGGETLPLLVVGPGFEGGNREHGRVSHTDIAATILSITGVEPPRSIQGVPLSPALAPD